jgi:uncharacterized coiled-coil DUF342 family protein
MVKTTMAQDLNYIRSQVDELNKSVSAMLVSQAGNGAILESIHQRLYAGNGHGGDINEIKQDIQQLKIFQATLQPITTETLPGVLKRVEKLERGKLLTIYTAVAVTLSVVWELIKFIAPRIH